MTETDSIRQELAQLLEGAGLALVDLFISRRKGGASVRATVYRKGGTGIDECAKAHRLIQPRLQVLLDLQDFHLEVASPGTERMLHESREYAIFAGRGIKAIFLGESEWTPCVIVGAEGDTVVLSTAEGEKKVPISEIVKARLDGAREG